MYYGNFWNNATRHVSIVQWRRFECIANTERLLQPTTLAISAGGQLLKVRLQICTCCESARFGAILGSACCEHEHLHFRAVVKGTTCTTQGSVRIWHMFERVFGLVEKSYQVVVMIINICSFSSKTNSTDSAVDVPSLKALVVSTEGHRG